MDKRKGPSLVLKASERFTHPIWALEGKSGSGVKTRWRGLIGGREGGKGSGATVQGRDAESLSLGSGSEEAREGTGSRAGTTRSSWHIWYG